MEEAVASNFEESYEKKVLAAAVAGSEAAVSAAMREYSRVYLKGARGRARAPIEKSEKAFKEFLSKGVAEGDEPLPREALDEDLRNLLVAASRSGIFGSAEFLLESGVSPKLEGGAGWTALHWAAGNADVELMKRLIDRGADVNAADLSGETALSLLASTYPLSVLTESKEVRKAMMAKGVELLLSAGADATDGRSGRTILEHAASRGFDEAIKMLVPKAEFGSALLLACCGGHGDATRILLEAGAGLWTPATGECRPFLGALSADGDDGYSSYAALSDFGDGVGEDDLESNFWFDGYDEKLERWKRWRESELLSKRLSSACSSSVASPNKARTKI